MALRRQMAHDAAHIANESHVEHAIGFVDDQGRHRTEAYKFLLDEIEQPAGRGDKNVDAGTHRGHLAALIDAAQNDGVLQLQIAAIGPQTLIDLDREFARGRQNQRAYTVRLHGRFIGR